MLQALLLLLDELLVVGVGADERHEALVERVGLDLLATQRALLQLQLEVLLDLSLGRVFEEAVLAEVVAAGEEDHGLAFGRDHQLQADAADVGLDLVVELLAELLGVLLAVLAAALLAHLLDQVDRIVLHPVLHVHLLADLLLLSLLVPDAPLLPVLPRLLVLHLL